MGLFDPGSVVTPVVAGSLPKKDEDEEFSERGFYFGSWHVK